MNGSELVGNVVIFFVALLVVGWMMTLVWGWVTGIKDWVELRWLRYLDRNGKL